MKPLVIYHANCADGFGAAFAAWLKFWDGAEYVPMQYGAEAQLNILALRSSLETRDVYILDFSFEKPTMNTLFSCAKRVVWLDHHKTAFEMWCGGIPESGFYYKNYVTGEDGSNYAPHLIALDNRKSGAMLAWEYFHPDKEVPMLSKHIDDYDRWQFKLEGTKEFIRALWSYAPWSFKQWNSMFPEDAPTLRNWKIEDLKKEGAAILSAHEQNVLAVVEGAGRRCRLQLPQTESERSEQHVIELYLKGLAANCPPHLASDVGHELANRSGTYGLIWHLDKDGRCKCSLRSNGDYDVSAIAKAFGGGGHKNAAGFEVPIETLLSWLVEGETK